MTISGYCPHCGTKITEVKVLGYFDDFTFRCWKCQRIAKNYELKYETKQIPIDSALDFDKKIC